MAHDKREVGEVVHDFIDEFDMLRCERNPGAGNADTAEDGKVKFHSERVERIHLLVVQRCAVAGREGADGSEIHTACMNFADLLDTRHDVGGIEFEAGEESIGMLGECTKTIRVIRVVPEHCFFDVVAFEVVDEERNWVDAFFGVGRNVLEHVLRRKAEVL